MALVTLAWSTTPAGATSAPHAATPSPITPNFWLVTSSGAVESYGVPSHGALSGQLNRPIVSAVVDQTLGGYWLVASDGGVFSFGDAAFHGSTGNITLRQPIVSMARTSGGTGYWMVAADGGVFSFGDARYMGSSAGTASEPVSRLVATDTSDGYWVVQQNGTMQAFGAAVGQTPPSQALMFEPITPGDKAVLFAFQQLGKPYIWGGNGPVGYDCSGLTLASWQNGAGIGFARVANDQYHTAGNSVALDQMAAGDLIFWGSNTADWTTIYHAGIYVGGNRIVESTGDHVQLNVIDQWGMSDIMPNGRRP